MNALVENFIKEQEEKSTDSKGTLDSSTALDDLNDYIFKVYLYGYVKKTILYSSMQIKKKTNLKKHKEQASLNIIDPNFNEERLNLIISDEVNVLDEFCNIEVDTPAFEEISNDQSLIQAINCLTERQKEIIHRCIIKGESDTYVATKLGITKQGVNKIKRTAIKKMKAKLEEDGKYGK